jgi:N-acetylmuramoyl-L-alanine amidase
MQIKWIGCAASNFREGRPTAQMPLAIVIHIMDGTIAGTDEWFNNPVAQVSAHYGVSKTGDIHQYVDESDTAFHAGTVVNPTWPLIKPSVNPNFYTIGIEHEGKADDVWPDAQLQASALLIADVAQRWDIQLNRDHVVKHHEIRASKTCPGTVDLDQLISMASSSATPSTVISTASVRIISSVRVRKQPTTLAQVVRVLPAGDTQSVSGFTLSGQRVNGNSAWYLDDNGNYLWAGATDFPNPTAAKGASAV